MGSTTAQYGLEGRWVRSKNFTYANKNATTAVLDVPAGTLIPAFGVVCVVVTPFSGGTPTIDVGESGDTDGWVDNANVTVGTAGAYTGTVAAGAGLAGTGKYYSAATTIDVVLPNEAITAGSGYVLAHMINVSDVIDD